MVYRHTESKRFQPGEAIREANDDQEGIAFNST
jgi:hypothetical protein